jgi:hypothetical protein
MASERYLKAKVSRLKREIREIEDYFYVQTGARDLHENAGMLERKRDDVVRGAVLQLHTAVEDLLNSLIIHKVLSAASVTRMAKLRSIEGKALRRMLFGGGSIGFDMKLNLAVANRVISSKIRDQLIVLNALRNKCSHNWLLKSPVRRGRRPAQSKPPLLLYAGDDLHKPAVLKNFCNQYGAVYVRLFMKL